MKDVLDGGKADNLDCTDLANKYNVPLNYIIEQLEKGTKVEREHTDEDYIAQEIARDHLSEDLNYYTKLQNIEKTAANLLAMPDSLKRDTQLLIANKNNDGRPVETSSIFIYTGSFENYCQQGYEYITKLFNTYFTLGNFNVQDKDTKELNNVLFNILGNNTNVLHTCIDEIEDQYKQNNPEEGIEKIRTHIIDFLIWTGAIDESEVATTAEPTDHMNGWELNDNRAPIGYKLNYSVNSKKKEGINMYLEKIAQESVWGKIAKDPDIDLKITILNDAIEEAESISELHKIRGDIQNEEMNGIFKDKDIDPYVNKMFMNAIVFLNTKADELQQDPPTIMENLNKENTMKLNSNTYVLTKESEDFTSLESTLKRIAQENEIENVEKVVVLASQDNVTIQYKIAKKDKDEKEDKKKDKDEKEDKGEKKKEDKK